MKVFLCYASNPSFWLEIIVASFFLIGTFFCLIASIGLLRLKGFYARLHMPSLITIGSVFCITTAYMIAIKANGHSFPYHGFILLFIVIIITPITSMMLGRGALYREMFFWVKADRKNLKSKSQKQEKSDKTDKKFKIKND